MLASRHGPVRVRIGEHPTLRDALSGLEARSLPSDASDDAVAARADELIAGIFDL